MLLIDNKPVTSALFNTLLEKALEGEPMPKRGSGQASVVTFHLKAHKENPAFRPGDEKPAIRFIGPMYCNFPNAYNQRNPIGGESLMDSRWLYTESQVTYDQAGNAVERNPTDIEFVAGHIQVDLLTKPDLFVWLKFHPNLEEGIGPNHSLPLFEEINVRKAKRKQFARERESARIHFEVYQMDQKRIESIAFGKGLVDNLYKEQMGADFEAFVRNEVLSWAKSNPDDWDAVKQGSDVLLYNAITAATNKGILQYREEIKRWVFIEKDGDNTICDVPAVYPRSATDYLVEFLTTQNPDAKAILMNLV